MHRVRLSLPYFKDFFWDAEVVCVDEKYLDLNREPLFTANIPKTIKIHRVKAFPKKLTMKFGVGSIALRSLWFYKIKVDKLLASKKYDLVYFSTTQFPICVLGNYWKKKFGVPYVIDFQDPWHTEYYQTKQKNERPKKYWFSYRLNKFLEPIGVKNLDGIIAVSAGYITDLQERYSNLIGKPSKVIPFSAAEDDFNIAKNSKTPLKFGSTNKLKIVYAGAVGTIMALGITKLLIAFKSLPSTVLDKTELYFLGTSYAGNGEGIPSVLPIAEKLGIVEGVFELTDRLSYYDALRHLKLSDGLMIIGSDDFDYNPSKIYTYLLANKAIFSILNKTSAGNDILSNYENVFQTFLGEDQAAINIKLKNFVEALLNKSENLQNEILFTPEIMTGEQVEIFEDVLKRK